jgi:hypothetical protein
MITPNMTKPPCVVDGVHCDKRYIACQAACEKYAEWLVIHEEEKADIRQKKMQERTVDDFLAQTNLRKKHHTILECGKRYRERGRKA